MTLKILIKTKKTDTFWYKDITQILRDAQDLLEHLDPGGEESYALRDKYGKEVGFVQLTKGE